MSESNVFIIINLGCEMLYVVDQRLKAQQVSPEKSTQVMRDITFVLLDPKFIQGLMAKTSNKTLITSEHCKTILNDITCCSIMRLDQVSMCKLWDLMTMLFKWQLFVSKHPQHLLDITFRHLDGIAKLYPEVKKSILVDYTKNILLDFWNQENQNGQEAIYRIILNWLEQYYVKISILIRLGFQMVDGSFVSSSEKKYFHDFFENAGENIYNKSIELDDNEQKNNQNQENSTAIDNFATQLKGGSSTNQVKNNKPEGFIVFDDLNFDIDNTGDKKEFETEFAELNIEYRPSVSTWENIIIQRKNNTGSTEKDLNNLLKKKLS